MDTFEFEDQEFDIEDQEEDTRPSTEISSYTVCRICGCYIDPSLGRFSPAETADREGTIDDPRAPGDWDDICDVDCYAG